MIEAKQRTRKASDMGGFRPLVILLLLAMLSVSFVLNNTAVSGATYDILVSTSPDRSSPVALDGQTVSGDIYVFTSPDTDVSQVEFYLDDETMSGEPFQTEGLEPYDFAGTASDGSAIPFDSLNLSNGEHTITAALDLTDGSQEVVTATFESSNEAPYDILLSKSSDRSNPVSLDGQTVSEDIYVFTGPDTDVSQVDFYLDDETMSGDPFKTEGVEPYDFAGTATDGNALAFNTLGISDGEHSITAAITLDDASQEVITATFNVENGGASFDILLSTAADRSDPASLDGQTVEGDIYVFTSPDSGVSQVEFFLNDEDMSGEPFKTEDVAPYDFAGTASDGNALPFDTTSLSDGSHTISARLYLSDNTITEVHGSVNVSNTDPAMAFNPNSLSFDLEEGETSSQSVDVAATDGTTPDFAISEDADWLTISPGSGTAPETLTVSADTSGLAPGAYSATVTATASGYLDGTLEVTLNIGASYDLLLSDAPDRSNPVSLDGQTVVDDIYVFTGPDSGVSQVDFYIDDDTMSGDPYRTEELEPYDLEGGASDGSALPFDTTALSDGSHTISARIYLSDGDFTDVHAAIEVANNAPSYAFDPDPVTMRVEPGESGSASVEVDTTDGSVADFTISDDASWLTLSPESGQTPEPLTATADTSGLDIGVYTATVTASGEGYIDASVTVELTVGCPPLTCAEALISPPYELDFSSDHGGVLDGDGVGTGFTWIDDTSNGDGYIPENLEVDTAQGLLDITTTGGLQVGSSNSLDNGLGVGIDAPSQVNVISTTLINPPAGSGNYEQAGLWFGNNEDNYVKLVINSSPSGTEIELLMEEDGETTSKTSVGVGGLSDKEVMLTLKADPNDRSITGSFILDGGGETNVGSVTAPGKFFSFDAARIDAQIGTDSFGGVFASHRNGPEPLVYSFDSFSVVKGESEATAGEYQFSRASFPVDFPSAMAWGPDDRLYVTEMFGQIHAITLDGNKDVVEDQSIDTLTDAFGTSRLTLGIAIDPESTPDNPILWVAHSHPSFTDAPADSSMVSKLSGPDFSNVEHVITGLPRSKANHAINEIHFGPEGKLFIAAGGNTGAGGRDTEDSGEFSDRGEMYLSAAILVADVKAAGFNGDCSPGDDIYATPDEETCDVEPYATGLRNAYDFTVHSNGGMYAPDNGLGVSGVVPPAVSHPCDDFGTEDPGDQPDNLYKIEQGNYYGHPNPARGECVFKDGSVQDTEPLPNWTQPIHSFGLNRSSNGIVEYTHEAFCGDLQGQLLVANYSVGDNIVRVKLSEDGESVVDAAELVGDFNNPLPLLQGPDGTIYVGEHGGNQVTALMPKDTGCWHEETPLPAELLDVGGAAIGDELYVVGGKTSSSHVSSMYIYDSVSESWSAGPDLPGEAVENPAVTTLNGKLYVFGGSTDPFSGAVGNAAVYDPATDAWTSLQSMPTPRGAPTAQAVDGLIYVAGGMTSDGASSAVVEVYDPSTDSWSSASSMGTRRDSAGSAGLDGKLYIFGGRTRDADGTELNGTLNTVEAYDPATDAWSPVASMPTGRRTMVVGVVDGRALLMGGEKTFEGATFEANEEYDPTTDTWRTLKKMATPRHGAAAGVINDAVHVVAGGPLGGSSFSDVHEVFAFESAP